MKKYGIYSLRPGRHEGSIRKIVVKDLKEFQDFCFKKTGNKIPVRSGYRSFYDQRLTFKKYGKHFSAKPGTSEHQLGLAVDFGFRKTFLNKKDFPKLTKCFHKNSEKYGFILPYGVLNLKYSYEPWHFRYIGKNYAKIIKDNGLEYTPWKFLENPHVYLQKLYNEKVLLEKNQETFFLINKKFWNKISLIFSLKENISAKIFLKRKINKSISESDGEKFREYVSAYKYLDRYKKGK